MTVTGYVFMVLNMLAAAAFLLLSAPVADYRQQKLRQIDEARRAIVEAPVKDINDKGDLVDVGKAPLPDQIESLQAQIGDWKLRQTQFESLIINDKAVLENQRITLESRKAVLGDELNNARGHQSNLNGTLASAEQETNSRDAELKQAAAETEQGETAKRRLDAEVATLRKGFDASLARLKEIRDRLKARHDELQALGRQFPDPPASSAAVAVANQ